MKGSGVTWSSLDGACVWGRVGYFPSWVVDKKQSASGPAAGFHTKREVHVSRLTLSTNRDRSTSKPKGFLIRLVSLSRAEAASQCCLSQRDMYESRS